MILDNTLLFTGTSNGATATIASGSYTDLPTSGTVISSNIIDLGIKSGVPSSANGGGARDIGIGDDPMLKLWANVTVAFNTLTSMHLLLEGAPDGGSGTPGSYYTLWTGPEVNLAQLFVGAQLANVDVPRPPPGQVLPRFLRLSFVVTGSANSTGLVMAGIVLDRFDQTTGTGGALSGYVPGITVSN